MLNATDQNILNIKSNARICCDTCCFLLDLGVLAGIVFVFWSSGLEFDICPGTFRTQRELGLGGGPARGAVCSILQT